VAGQRILVVDDEPPIVGLVTAYLEHEGFDVLSAADGPTALMQARLHHPHLVVLDLMLPGMDGLEVCRRLRQESPVYILMLTARAEETDKVIGLGLGADDYLTKPFSPKELVARVKAILRRERPTQGTAAPGDQLVFPTITIDVARRAVSRDGQPMELTAAWCSAGRSCCSGCGATISWVTSAWWTCISGCCARRWSRCQRPLRWSRPCAGSAISLRTRPPWAARSHDDHSRRR